MLKRFTKWLAQCFRNKEKAVKEAKDCISGKGKKKPKAESKPKGLPPPKQNDKFINEVRLYAARIAAAMDALPSVDQDTPEIAFLITPWLATPVPLFSIELAFQARLKGRPVVLIFDATNLLANAERQDEIDALANLLRDQTSWARLVDFSSYTGELPKTTDESSANRILTENTIWRARGESTPTTGFQDRDLRCSGIADHLAKVRHLLSNLGAYRLVVPGGIYGLSASYVEACSGVNLDFTSYDSGRRGTIWSQNSVAAHRNDLGLAVAEMDVRLTETQRAQVKTTADEVLSLRVTGRDAFGYQKVGTSDTSYGYDILMPLNVRWDAAALGRERLFPSFTHWIEAVLQWLETRPQWSICIRDHPAQRLLPKELISKDDYSSVISKYSSLADRLRFVNGDDDVNTYDVIKTAKVVLPFTSTIGIEAVMLDKPVILSSHCYYENIGFASSAQTVEKYFELIEMALTGALQVSERQKELAELTYYITQNCSAVRGRFNPRSLQFSEWVQHTPVEMSSWLDLKLPLQSILTGAPLPVLVHELRMLGIYEENSA